MRRFMLDDLLAGAARLTQAAPNERRELADRLLSESHAAHHYMRRTGKPHPRWGNGSLMARALAEKGEPRPLCLASLAVMATAVVEFRATNAARGHGLSTQTTLC